MSEYLENLIDYKIITLYPTLIYLVFNFCSVIYNYKMVDLELEMYDNTFDEYVPLQTNSSDIKSHDSSYYSNMLFAFNQIPT